MTPTPRKEWLSRDNSIVAFQGTKNWQIEVIDEDLGQKLASLGVESMQFKTRKEITEFLQSLLPHVNWQWRSHQKEYKIADKVYLLGNYKEGWRFLTWDKLPPGHFLLQKPCFATRKQAIVWFYQQIQNTKVEF